MTESQTPTQPVKAPAKRPFRWFRACVRLLALAIFALLGLLGWVIGSEQGSQFAVRMANENSGGVVKIDGWSGRLWDVWHVERFALNLASLRLTITQLDAQWHPKLLAGKELNFDVLRANTIEVRSAPSTEKTTEPTPVPSSFDFGWDVHVGQLQVTQLLMSTFALDKSGAPVAEQPEPDVVLSDIQGRLDTIGGEFKVDNLALTTPAGRLSGFAHMGSTTPFPLSAQLALVGKLQERPVQVDAQVVGTLLIPRVLLQASSEEVSGSGDLMLQPFAALPVRRAVLDFKNINPKAFAPAAPEALLDVSVQITPSLPEGLKHPPTLDDWRAQGSVTVTNHRAGAIDQDALPITSLFSNLTWSSGRLLAENLKIQLPAGSNKDKKTPAGLIQGQLQWQAVKNEAAGQVQGELQLSHIDPSTITQAAQSMSIQGQITATASAKSQLVQLKLNADHLDLSAQVEQRENTLFIKQLQLLAGQGKASISGQMQLKDAQSFSLKGALDKLDPNVLASAAPSGQINATFNVAGNLTPDWLAKIELALQPSALAGHELSGSAKMQLAASQIKDAQVKLNILDNLIHLQGNYGKPNDELTYKLDAPHLDRLGSHFGGTAFLEGNLRGVVGSLTGAFKAHAKSLKLPGDVSIASLEAKANMQEGINGQVHASINLDRLRVGTQEVIGSEGKKHSEPKDPIIEKANFTLDGRRKEHTLSATAQLMQGQTLSLSGTGAWSDEHSWRGLIKNLQAKGPVSFELIEPVTLNASSGHVVIGAARLKAQNGDVRLDLTDISANRVLAKGSITGVQVGFSVDQNQRNVGGGRSLRLGGDWDIDFGEKVKGLVRIQRESGDFILQGDVPVAMGLEQLEVSLSAQDDRVTLNTRISGKRSGDINLVASAATLGKGANVRLNPDAQLVGVGSIQIPSIDWMGPFIDQNMQLAGAVRGDFHILGTPSNPKGAGNVKGQNIEFGMADQGLRLTKGNVQIDFDNELISLKTFSFTSANTLDAPDSRLRVLKLNAKPGALTGSGTLKLTTGEGKFHLNLDKIGVLQQNNQWMLASGTADIDTGWDRFNLLANLRADGGYIGVQKSSAPSLSKDVIVRGTKPKEPSAMKMNANITFDMGNHFILKAYGIDTYLSGKLNLIIAEGPMTASGSIQTKGGSFDAYGRKLDIERGIVTFHGRIDNPSLNVVALRKGLAVEAGVEVTGSAQAPRVTLVSEPNVPETEKLSWILLGRASEVDSGDTGLLLSAASAILGGGSSTEGGFVDRVAREIGLDEISIGDQVVGGSSGAQSQVARNATGLGSSINSAGITGDQVVTLGKRISTSTYLAFEQNLSGTESVARISYALTRFISVILRAGTDNSINVSYSVSFK